jgi:hypothetical protein
VTCGETGRVVCSTGTGVAGVAGAACVNETGVPAGAAVTSGCGTGPVSPEHPENMANAIASPAARKKTVLVSRISASRIPSGTVWPSGK